MCIRLPSRKHYCGGGASALSDKELKNRVKQALLDNTESAGIDVHVDVNEGVVQLSGIVDVLSHRQQAEVIARGVEGVHEVKNGITVAMDGDVADEAIESALRGELGGNRLTRGIGIDVVRGRVTLLGRVDNLAQAREAYRLASGTRGVREVASELRLDEAAPDDATVVNWVEQTLKDAGLDERHIDTAAENGRLRLSGWVDNPSQRQLVEDLASKVDGVRAVDNELDLRSGEREV